MTQLAGALGISQSTVSRVLNNCEKGRVSPEVAQRVRDYAQKVGFARNTSAATLRSGKSNVISLIIPWNIPELVDTIERECSRNGLNLLVQLTPEPDLKAELRSLNIALEKQVDAIIWEPSCLVDLKSIPRIDDLVQKTVFLGEKTVGLPAIHFDYRNGLVKLFSHAVDQGYEHIVLVNIDGSDIYFFEKHPVYEQISHTCVDELGINFLDDHYRENTLFVCGNDWLGIKLIHLLAEQRIRVPQDAGIALMGDLLLGSQFRLAEILPVPVTSLVRDFKSIGLLAVERVIRRQDFNREALIPLELIERKSTQRRQGDF